MRLGLRVGAAALALAAAAAGLFTAAHVSRPPVPPEIGGYVLNSPRSLPDFELIDGEGHAFRERDFEGAWSFLYFGYTYCPDVCPLSMVEMARLKQVLDHTMPGQKTRYYLVSVDPARDTPERIGEYATYFDPDFSGLTGEREEIDKLARAASVLYQIPAEARKDEPYLVGHSSTITLIDPRGEVYAIFTTPLDGERIAADFEKVVAYAGR